MELQKATIAELDGDNEKDSFPVQFNPTTLRLALTNRVEGGDSQGKQVRQHIGASSTTLSLDLVFDTADEGTTENPRSVRDKTKKIERFLVSKGKGKQENAPPRIRFTWGDLIVEGVVESLTIDFDHFAPNGVPLRAKVPLSIKGQDREKELQTSSDSRSGAPAPGGAATGGLGGPLGGGASGGLGFGASAGIGIGVGVGIGGSVGIGIGASTSIGVALEGESAGEFAARVGVDPAAWRGLQMGGESSLSLSAGVEVGFDVNLNASAGLGVTVGVEAGTNASVEEKLGLSTGPGLNAVSGVGIGADLASGFALSSAGGLGAALELAQVSKNSAVEAETRSAFNAPARALPPGTATTQAPSSSQTSVSSTASNHATMPAARPEPVRAPLSQTGFPSVSAQAAASPAPRPPRADARAGSFGFGVPLRSTVGAAADRRAESIQGDVAVRPRVFSGEPPMTTDPTTPGWIALPAGTTGRTMADGIQHTRQGCGCGCKH
jgi:hypothetical protein